MKKHLTIAAVLGAVAIIGVSVLAQAEPHAAAVETAVEKAVDAPAAAAGAAVAVDASAKIKADCEASATTGTDAEKAAFVEKCVAEASVKTEEHAAPAAGHAAE